MAGLHGRHLGLGPSPAGGTTATPAPSLARLDPAGRGGPGQGKRVI